MKREVYAFGGLLILITIIGALSGLFRYRENFLNEVFDIEDNFGEVKEVTGNTTYATENAATLETDDVADDTVKSVDTENEVNDILVSSDEVEEESLVSEVDAFENETTSYASF